MSGATGRTVGSRLVMPYGRLLWPAIIAVGVVLGGLTAKWPFLTVALVAVIAVSAVLFMNRELALGTLLLTSLVSLSIIRWLGLPDQVGLMTEGLLLIFVLSVVFDWNRETRFEIPIVFIAFAVVLVVSAIFGSSSRVLALQSMGAYAGPLILYVAIVHSDLSVAAMRRLTIMVAAIVALQVPLIVIQSRTETNVDHIGGTFGHGGSTHMLAIVFGITWTIAVSMLRGKRALWLIPIGIAISASLILNQAKAGFMFIALGTVVVGVFKAFADPRRGPLFALGYIGLGFGSLAILFGTYVYLAPYIPGGAVEAQYWARWLRSPTLMWRYLVAPDPKGQASRIGGTILVSKQAQSWADILIGHGPGLLSASAVSGESTSTATSVGAALKWATSITRFLFEIGIVGILLYIAALFAVVGSIAKAWAYRTDKVGLGITAAAAGSVAIYIAAAFYHAPWTIDAISIPFWCLLGIAVRWGRLRNEAATSAEAQPAAEPLAAVEPSA